MQSDLEDGEREPLVQRERERGGLGRFRMRVVSKADERNNLVKPNHIQHCADDIVTDIHLTKSFEVGQDADPCIYGYRKHTAVWLVIYRAIPRHGERTLTLYILYSGWVRTIYIVWMGVVVS